MAWVQIGWGQDCALSITPPNIDFGTKPGCSVVKSAFTVYSMCSQPRAFIDVTVSESENWLTLESNPNFRLKALDKEYIQFSAKFPKRLGGFAGTITLKWRPSFGLPGEKKVKVTGTVRDSNLVVEPTEINIGQHSPGKEVATGFNVKNRGNCTLAISAYSTKGWIRKFYPSNFVLSPYHKQEGVFVSLRVPEKPGPFTGIITVKSDAGHRKDITVRGETKGIDLRADKITRLTVALEWNNMPSMGSKIRKYVIYRDHEIIGTRTYKADPPSMAYVDTNLPCGTTYEYKVEAVDDQGKSLFQSNTLSVITKKRYLEAPPFRVMPIFGAGVTALGYFTDNGIDFYAPIGSECRAVTDGTITYAGDTGNERVGKIVYLEPNKPITYDGLPVDSVFYSHLDEILVHAGEPVKEGDVIGLSGEANSAKHLHFGIYAGQPNIYKVGDKEYDWWECFSRDQVYDMLNLCFGQRMWEYCEGGSAFGDVLADYWACKYIETLRLNGYVTGDGRKYYPEGIVTRAVAAIYLLRAVYGPDYVPPRPTEEAMVFEDVSTDDWYAGWVTQLYEAGITKGCRTDFNGLYYCPLRPLSRAEAATFWVRILNGPDYIPEEPKQGNIPFPFDDVVLGTWYAKWVYEARKDGIVGSCEDLENLRDNLYRPSDPTTRAEMACMMYKALKALGMLP
jgi:murein DD-endopeptidase MepM/ murein hydrolase activator NlpD